ncbi:MAG: PQQ-binding-like beta-propeller repeat protein, partial [Bryobacteraceae bacterium]
MRFATLLITASALLAADDDWPRWRGPNHDGMARGDAPTEWSDTKNVAWKVAVPGRGHSSPVIWGNKIFITTALPVETGPASIPAAGGPAQAPQGGR